MHHIFSKQTERFQFVTEMNCLWKKNYELRKWKEWQIFWHIVIVPLLQNDEFAEQGMVTVFILRLNKWSDVILGIYTFVTSQKHSFLELKVKCWDKCYISTFLSNLRWDRDFFYSYKKQCYTFQCMYTLVMQSVQKNREHLIHFN